MVDPAAIKKEWKEIFSTMDQDQSGSITCNELYKFIVKVSDNLERMVTPKTLVHFDFKVAKLENGGEAKEVDWDEVKTIFKGLDKDGDRSVEWEEFFVRLFLPNLSI